MNLQKDGRERAREAEHEVDDVTTMILDSSGRYDQRFWVSTNIDVSGSRSIRNSPILDALRAFQPLVR